jgi:Spy/CpxP family protein refolding chaperone
LGGPPGPPPPPGSEIPDLWSAPPDLIEKLKLTDDQLKQLRLGFVEFKEKTRKARNALMAVRDEKETMLLSGKIDQAKLAKLDEETTKLASEVLTEHLKIKREQLSKLTPEQLERLPLCLGKGRMPHGPKMTAK